jgi:hypothetical protein
MMCYRYWGQGPDRKCTGVVQLAHQPSQTNPGVQFVWSKRWVHGTEGAMQQQANTEAMFLPGCRQYQHEALQRRPCRFSHKADHTSLL